jgi:phosphoribosylglycinamide formyltransferase 1
MRNIAIFASGSGSNAQNIVDFFKNQDKIIVDCILSNREDAFVLERAKKIGVDTQVFTRGDFYGSQKVLGYLQARGIDFIVLAGFLWLVPAYLTAAYPKRIINIHPALLPKYGGKGMYGMNVHKAVVKNGEKYSGITIHYVNDKYDDGDIIFQAECPVYDGDTPEQVAEKVHQLEYEHFPKIIEKLVLMV